MQCDLKEIMARGYLVSLDKAVSGYSVAFVVFYNGAKLQTVEQGYRILVLVADDVSEKQQFSPEHTSPGACSWKCWM